MNDVTFIGTPKFSNSLQYFFWSQLLFENFVCSNYEYLLTTLSGNSQIIEQCSLRVETTFISPSNSLGFESQLLSRTEDFLIRSSV